MLAFFRRVCFAGNEMLELNRIYNGDCREVMKKIPDKSVVVITDPVWPNSTDIPGGDRPYELFAEAFKQINRIAYRVVIQLGCDSDPRIFAPLELPFIRVVSMKYLIPHYKGRILYGGDMAYAFGDIPSSQPHQRVLPGEYLYKSNSEKKPNHPCPRRLSHTLDIVIDYTRYGDVVVDPFAGSGTTAVASMRAERDFIAIEISKEFCKEAQYRIDIESAKLKLPLYTKKSQPGAKRGDHGILCSINGNVPANRSHVSD